MALHYLFFAVGGGGSFLPLVAVAQQLQAAGHQVTFASMPREEQMIRHNGFHFHRLHRTATRYNRHKTWERLTVGVVVNDEHLAELPDVVALVRPDHVVVDCIMMCGQAALQLSVPVTILYHTNMSGAATVELFPTPVEESAPSHSC